jgi:glycosyltransferase involved in cell wall biosynthesis
VRIVHGRTFIGGLIGCIAGTACHRPVVYHNEGFWPDQQVEAGFWSRDHWLYRTMKAIERRLYESADGLLLLSQRSVAIVGALPGVRRRCPPIAVVPSCVDLSRFQCQAVKPAWPPVRLTYVGSLGGRYLTAPLAHFLCALRKLEPSATLTILSQSSAAAIQDCMRAAGAADDAWTVATVPHVDVPSLLCRAHAGLLFQAGGVGGASGSPTKVGEYWACGLPVVTLPGIGDADEVIASDRVGVTVPDLSPASLEWAAAELLKLLQDPGHPRRCRAAAERTYSLERGLDVQLALYKRLENGASAAP